MSFLNSARTINKCIEAVLAQDYPQELFELVVVDAGSIDGSTEVCERLQSEHPNMRLIVKPGATEAEGQAVGVAASDSEVIMFTNSDIYVPSNWIRKHVSWLARGYDLVGGKVFWGGDKYAFTWNMPTPSRPRFVQEQGLGLGFSNCSTTRRTFNEVGALSSLKSQHDTEFAFRVVRSGGRMVLDPEIEVYHDHPFLSLRGSFKRSLGYAVNHVLVMRGVYGRIVSGSGQPAMMPAGALLREWTCITGIRVYKENIEKASRAGIRVGLLEFLAIRLLSTKLGQGVGVFLGATRRKSSLGVKDLHSRSRRGVDRASPREAASNGEIQVLA